MSSSLSGHLSSKVSSFLVRKCKDEHQVKERNHEDTDNIFDASFDFKGFASNDQVIRQIYKEVLKIGTEVSEMKMSRDDK